MDINHLCTVKRIHSGTYLPCLPHNASWFQRLKRRFRSWTLISKDHPKCIEYFKSATGIRRERKRHARSPNFYIIHPFSQFRIYYEMYMILVYLAILFIRFADYRLVRKITKFELAYDILCFLCIADIIMTFFTGYAQRDPPEVVIDPKRIALRYLKSMFLLVDLAAFFPAKLLIYTIDDETQLRISICINVVRLLLVVRLYTVNKYVTNTAEYYGVSNRNIFIAVRQMGCLLIIIHCLNMVHFVMPQLRMIKNFIVDKKSYIRTSKLITNHYHRYFPIVTMVCGLVFGSSANVATPEIWEEVCMHIATAIFGKFYCIFFTVMILHMMMSSRNLDIKYSRIMGQLEEYMTYKDLPMSMRRKLRMYYDYKYQKKFFRETAIGSILSDSLNREIKIHVCRKLIKDVTLFAGLSTQTVSDVLEYLKLEVYLPNDTIIKAGDPGDCIYLLSRGTVAVYTAAGKELCHLHDGAYFGEISLIMKDQLRTANVYAVEICEVYSLERRYFKRYVLKNAELYHQLYQNAEDRLEMLTNFEEYHRFARKK